ncbi:serine/threonine-protein kinase [Streptomyces sp. MP131-18]|uniref:serine/threonine-protein kinase n=1 Tax=Streptomyces sp. MP131-18 TaxID=1857892 RepID=UPI0009D38C89|nr:serine/threonine-protein kinase [Streptomyces sp. MP131-18]ONK15042.1 Serine/threonine-protein kinase PknL [Streptomyces sp. MP131-18]
MAGAQPGQIIDDRFELLARLGAGGMGTVWRARDLALHREVALKEVRPADQMARSGPDAERTLRERVLREARALARIDHPNVVRIYHIVDIEPHPWLVMELLPGNSLEALARRGPLPPAEAIRLGRDVLAGLRAAHAAGIHHRDVKPANVLLRDGGSSAVLTDFGIAAVAGSTSLTVTGGIVGSPEYIAPERIRGAPDHPAADLWSLGVMLYVLTEGYSPLRRGTTLATLSAVLEDPVPPPVRSGPLGDVLRILLVKDPAARPDAARLDAMLAQAQAPPPTPQTPQAAWAYAPTGTNAVPPARGRSRSALVAGIAAGAVLLAGGITAALVLPGGGTEANGSDGPTPTPSDTAEPPPSEDPTGDPTGEASEEPTAEPPRETDPAPGDLDPGTWIAQLFSEPVATGTEVRDQRLAAIRASVPEADVLLSDDYASLNPGYWVIYVSDDFEDGTDAVEFCAEHGLTDGNACVGRYLSDSPGDADLICHPMDGGSGRCEED